MLKDKSNLADMPYEFEPMETVKLPKFYSVNSERVEAVREAMERHSPVAKCAMEYALQLLGLEDKLC